MPPVNVLKFPTSSPSDTSPLPLLKNAGYEPSQVLGVVGKTEGTDSSRSSSLHLAGASGFSYAWLALLVHHTIPCWASFTAHAVLRTSNLLKFSASSNFQACVDYRRQVMAVSTTSPAHLARMSGSPSSRLPP
jgi:hypothetical protein